MNNPVIVSVVTWRLTHGKTGASYALHYNDQDIQSQLIMKVFSV